MKHNYNIAATTNQTVRENAYYDFILQRDRTRKQRIEQERQHQREQLMCLNGGKSDDAKTE